MEGGLTRVLWIIESVTKGEICSSRSEIMFAEEIRRGRGGYRVAIGVGAGA